MHAHHSVVTGVGGGQLALDYRWRYSSAYFNSSTLTLQPNSLFNQWAPEGLAVRWGPSLSCTLCHKPIHSAAIHKPVSLRQTQSEQSTVPCLRLVHSLTLTHLSYTAWPVQMEPTGSPETSVTTDLCCVTSQKNEDLTVIGLQSQNAAPQPTIFVSIINW